MAFFSGNEALLIDIVLAQQASSDAMDSGSLVLFMDSRLAKSRLRTAFLVTEAWKIQLHVQPTMCQGKSQKPSTS